MDMADVVEVMSEQPYLQAFRGQFWGVLRWHHLDDLWQRVLEDAEGGWYVYAVGEAPPETAMSGEPLAKLVRELDILLREEHKEDYCGIVYADDLQKPSYIKVFDPHNLGAVCGSSGAPPPLPGWILSKMQPIDLPAAMPQPGNRRRWWRKLLA